MRTLEPDRRNMNRRNEVDVSKHTPGPWRAWENTFSDTFGHWTISGTKSEGIAEIVGHLGQPREEDARLIAAAPAMLAALNLVTGALLGWMEIADDDDERDSDRLAVEAARLAIAAAEGQDQ